MKVCNKCKSPKQVWKNQNTGRLTCHRLTCENNEEIVDNECYDCVDYQNSNGYVMCGVCSKNPMLTDMYRKTNERCSDEPQRAN